jgi:putative transposase
MVGMLKQWAYQFELRPKSTQSRLLRQYVGTVRWVWNQALALQKARLENKETCLKYVETAGLLPGWKASYPFLKEAPSQPLQQTLKDLDLALRDAFSKKSPKRFPRFKKRGQRDSLRYPQGVKLQQENSRLFLPKIGWVRYRNSCRVEGALKNVTVRWHGGRWLVSLQVEQEVATPFHPSTSEVGVDVGVAQLVTCSNGVTYPPLNSYQKDLKRLKREQQKLSRKVFRSRNYLRQQARVQWVHEGIANRRRDYLHKVTTNLSKNHARVVVELLQVGNLSASARGTVLSPGRRVRAKAGLNRAILDQGWYEFRRQLDYKLRWRGGELVTVAPHYTSQRCSACGHTTSENRVTQTRFVCVGCGFKLNADENAARNILAAGRAVSACGECVRPGATRAGLLKQEPPEGQQASA